jgi:soluble lytic murein transglycosylase-like protein
VAKVESNFDPFAVSPRGACGILQLMPKTARRFGVEKIFDADQNIDGGARYLRWLLDRFGGRVDLALAGYNAGEGAVERHRGIPPFAETQWYVLKVLDRATQGGQSSPR